MERAAAFALFATLLVACGNEGDRPAADDTGTDTSADDAVPATDTAHHRDVLTEVDVGPTDTAPADVDLTPRTLSECSGSATVIDSTRATGGSELRRLTGDAQVRGYLESCDGSTQIVRIRQNCGGTIHLTLGGASSAVWEASVRVPEVAEAGELRLSTAPAASANGAIELATWVDADASGDFAVELELACDGSNGGTWSLHVDGPSTQPVAQAENGYPVELPLSGDVGDACVMGQTPPAIEGFVDRLGNTVSLTQFHGDMLLLEFGMMWCAPCQSFARRSDALATSAELASAEYGVRVISVLAEDYDGLPTTAEKLAQWSEDYGVNGVVLGGPGAAALNEECGVELFPTLYILDPNMVIRGALLGTESDDEILERVERAWQDFRRDNPGWVSPRCRGVLDAGDVCACIDDRSYPDADADTVPDACDSCIGEDDRVNNERTGRPLVCDPPDGRYRNPVVVRQYVEFAYESADGRVPFWSIVDSDVVLRPLIITRLYDSSRICSIVREATAELEAAMFPTDPFDAIATFELNASNSVLSHNCTNRLDPAEWGNDLSAMFESVDWGFAVIPRCPLIECDGSYEGVWLRMRHLVPGTEDCDPWLEGCADALLGGAPYFLTVGIVGEIGGMEAIAWALQVSASWNLTQSRRWIPSTEVIAGVERAVFIGESAFEPWAYTVRQMLGPPVEE